MTPALTKHAIKQFQTRVRPKGLFDDPVRAERKLQELLDQATPAGFSGNPCLRARYGDQDFFLLVSPDQEVITTVVAHPIKPSKETYDSRKRSAAPPPPARRPAARS